MSVHSVKVVRVKEILPHPDADALEIVEVWGYSCCVKKGDFKAGDLAIYIEPDYVVPDNPLFAWLKDKRVRVRRLRGVLSQGLLIPAQDGMQEGDNVIEVLGISRYEPPVKFSMGDVEPGPALWCPKYDVENLERFPLTIATEEVVSATEKLHGTNAKFCFAEGRMWAGSRTYWRKNDDACLYWKPTSTQPQIEAWCRDNPNRIIYGEIYGWVQDLKYGAEQGQVWFSAFDVLDGNRFFDVDEFDVSLAKHEVARVPELYRGPMSGLNVEVLRSGNSFYCQHIREGIVIKPVKERLTLEIGRVILKAVNPDYLMKGLP